MNDATPSDTSIPYATPAPRTASRLWAGVFIAFAGLCLILLGGCFLIGVLIMVHPELTFGGRNPPPATLAHYVLLAILYLLGFLCFGAAAAVLIRGLKVLFAYMR
ncbi:MAG: hypothetical protein JWO87_1150 [Phycisphaerales bacterium]|jgi:hypothetical protein|nr:hypothetical protein [Phycisphaerales bacterium]MDB5299487.1 hypothetical protein [Phycisphaerales bacterium]